VGHGSGGEIWVMGVRLRRAEEGPVKGGSRRAHLETGEG
jgi:hypothetical protein